MVSFGTSRPIVTRGSRASRAPLHHTYNAFLNPHGILFALSILNLPKDYINRQIIGTPEIIIIIICAVIFVLGIIGNAMTLWAGYAS